VIVLLSPLPKAEAARAIAPFTELIKSPEHIHTYRITPLSIWNARAGTPIENIIDALRQHSKYPVPDAIVQEIEVLGRRYGDCDRAIADGFSLLLRVSDHP